MMSTCRKDPGIPTDSFYEIRAGCTDVPTTKFRIKAGKTLCVKRWRAAFTTEGYLDIRKCLNRIYHGEFIHQYEEKCGNFFLVVMILKVHLMNGKKYDKEEGNLYLLVWCRGGNFYTLTNKWGDFDCS
ncbi:hypothetical protein R6Q59_012567 [Mikania micrantha]